MSDAETMRFWLTPPHPDRETTARWLDSMIAAPADAGDDFIVELSGRTIRSMTVARSGPAC